MVYLLIFCWSESVGVSKIILQDQNVLKDSLGLVKPSYVEDIKRIYFWSAICNHPYLSFYHSIGIINISTIFYACNLFYFVNFFKIFCRLIS